MNAEALTQAVDLLQPHVLAVALVSARLVPVAFLCPLFGGTHAPTHVKLGVVLALSLFLHLAGGVVAPATSSTFELGSQRSSSAISLENGAERRPNHSRSEDRIEVLRRLARIGRP